jgi:hypothetical protein
MNKERSEEIEFLRSEMMGPARPVSDAFPGHLVAFDSANACLLPPDKELKGSVFWHPDGVERLQEVIRRETPDQRYGIGLLYPGNCRNTPDDKELISEAPSDDEAPNDEAPISLFLDNEKDSSGYSKDEAAPIYGADDDDFSVNGNDAYKPSTIGISFCIDENTHGDLVIRLPLEKRFFWQTPESEPFSVNGIYESCKTVQTGSDGTNALRDGWRRKPAMVSEKVFTFPIDKVLKERLTKENVVLINGIQLQIDLYSRSSFDRRIITVVLRNKQDAYNQTNRSIIEQTLYQTCFEVEVQNGAAFAEYPEGRGELKDLDDDEQTLSLLYRKSANWAIGHSCAATWTAEEGETPTKIVADCMPAVELPSMTPDIEINGKELKLSMRDLAEIQNTNASDSGWASLESLVSAYKQWISDKRNESKSLATAQKETAEKHLDGCYRCLSRMEKGMKCLSEKPDILEAFRLANQAMWLQQVATKDLTHRPLIKVKKWAEPVAPHAAYSSNPWQAWNNIERPSHKYWRAFQAAFLLMSLDSFADDFSDDRDIVDLIWFPTGGGKTEAYLGVAAFYMFLQRLEPSDNGLRKDGTNVFMRYTLRMLTTQQFQRAASLICAMEFLRTSSKAKLGDKRFSLGLWVGRDASPNKWKDAVSAIKQFGEGKVAGNPLVLTECPWCRSEIGRVSEGKSNKYLIAGIRDYQSSKGCPALTCSDPSCHFGGEHDSGLPVEVIDEALYQNPPSMFISTADKFAMLAFKPEAGALLGMGHGPKGDGEIQRVAEPPGLIIQDEFHLISGPLGSIYGLYETIIEKLCTRDIKGHSIKPKVIASTATIRGAIEQTRAVYSRNKDELQLFPNPGLDISDSFFGRYARDNDGTLKQGRLYLGINATGYKSFLTTQVRAFSAAMFRSSLFPGENKDPWWTLLAFYNSLRELGGARTLFSSDISARMKDFAHRYGIEKEQTRYLNKVEELTSRRSQAELVHLMDQLALHWKESYKPIDACLASNIIEVGVDIDRLSLMAVVGQPKSTAQYIQVSGRVGRRWWERPGLIMMMYNPNKSRDLSHFEQFQSYHQRLYEQVEPTSATPFSIETVKRAAAGIMLLWARQHYKSESPKDGSFNNYTSAIEEARDFLIVRCEGLFNDHENEACRVVNVIEETCKKLIQRGKKNPLMWQEYPQKRDGSYLMLWPGSHATQAQQRTGTVVLSSMRNVDGTAQLKISSQYMDEEGF